MELVKIEGYEKPQIIYTPYIYATMYEHSLHYLVKERGKIKVIEKKDKKYEID